MARFSFATLLLATALLQATFIPATGLMGIFPDVVLVFLLIWSATHGVAEGMVWAFGLGLWMDLLTLEPLGTHGIALLAVAVIGGAAQGRLFRSGAILPVVTVVVATLAYGLVGTVVALARGETVYLASGARLAVMTALLNALLVPIAYGLLLVFDRWIPRRV
jgi:rod shape-determining protein MreD